MDFVVQVVKDLQNLVAAFSDQENDLIILQNVFDRLNLFSFEQVCLLFHQPDIITLIKSYLHYENNNELQSYSIPVFSALLLKLYILLYLKCPEISFDSYATLFESQNDIQRYREDLTDFILEEFKWIFSIISKETSDKHLKNGCELFVSKVLHAFHDCENSFRDLLDSILSIQEANFNHIFISNQYLTKRGFELRRALGPIIDLLLTTLQSPLDQHFLFRLYDRVMRSPSWIENEVSIQLWNDFTLFLLCGSSSSGIAQEAEGIVLDLTDEGTLQQNQTKTIFLVEKMESTLDELTLPSRNCKRLTLPLSRLIEDWLSEGVVLMVQRSSSPLEKLKGIKYMFVLLLVYDFPLEPEVRRFIFSFSLLRVPLFLYCNFFRRFS